MGISRRLCFLGIGAPVCYFAAATDLDSDNTKALLACVPRTARALHWAGAAGWDYYRHLHGTSTSDWTALHIKWADCLTSVCRENGGIYVKVHRARLQTGEEVALKVQYPALKTAVSADLRCLMILSALSDWVFSNYPMGWMFHQLRDQIFQEMDFTVEAANAQRLQQRMQHRPEIRVPKMHIHLCTPRLLVMEWINGCRLSDKDRLRQFGINPRSVALTLIDAFSEMTLVQGVVHADPHPGNLLIIPTPYAHRRSWWRRLLTFEWRTPFQLVLLDHGRYLLMDPIMRRDYCQLWCCLVRGDRRSAVEIATRMCKGDSGGRLLPAVLERPFNQKTRQQMKSDAGFSELMDILQTAPQALVDALRIVAVVRHVAAALADIKLDRCTTNKSDFP